jgi:hypothetical protein
MALEAVRRGFVSDFYDSWDSLAASRTATGRGNFMYAFMATNYLEWAARVASQNHAVAVRLASELYGSDGHYFAKLPPGWPTKPAKWFPPSKDGNQDHWLWVVFDLVRNGIAHRYQQMDADLADGHFRVLLVGAEKRAFRPGGVRPPTHFRPFEVKAPTGTNYLVMRLFPDVLFSDVDTAVNASGVLQLKPMDTFRRNYPVTIGRLRKAIGIGRRPPPR